MNKIYSPDIPDFFAEFSKAPAMQRIKRVGMHCGCEYTSFPLFEGLSEYSRYEHSVGVGLITWRFTKDIKQAIAALFHDIATPVFAHTIDFLNGDYITQESTENQTESIIRNSEEIGILLKKYKLRAEDVIDYHIYPIADNEAPGLCADRLEYTLSNLINFCGGDLKKVKALYDDICVAENEAGAFELSFRHLEKAAEFAFIALRCAKVYVADEDRYSMQMLSELVKDGIEKGVITKKDLYTDEPKVLAKFENDEEMKSAWEKYCSYHKMLYGDEQKKAAVRYIQAKKRLIDPFVAEVGRVSELDRDFAEAKEEFLGIKFDAPLSAI
ncbi:MAG: HD domain-containing protein [Lachnospiraceae bacterium]|nr:HD domain-containing protein [Lachnospiraceae bacterium]